MSWRPEGEASTSRVTLDHLRAPKVNQVDADELDEGLAQMLGERVERSLANFKTSLSLDIKPELELVLKLVMFRYSFFSGPKIASPGASLQNLKLVSSTSHHPPRRKLLLYLLLHPPIFPTYILTRLRNRALSNQWPDLPPSDWRRKLWGLINRLENVARAWELLGWGMFLYDGKSPSLLMRLLGLRLVPSSPHLAKMVSYEFMNRQLVWSAFTEFLMFAIPRMPRLPRSLAPSSLLAPLLSFFSQSTRIDYDSILLRPEPSSALTPGNRRKRSRAGHSGPLADLSFSTCPICHQRATSAPVSLTSSSTGSSLTLPPLLGPNTGFGSAQSMGMGVSGQFGPGHAADPEETRIFVPAQSDCWGGCRWCYYCISGELIRFKQNLEQKRGKVAEAVESTDHPKWECLRCGGGVSRSWRVGAEDFGDYETDDMQSGV